MQILRLLLIMFFTITSGLSVAQASHRHVITPHNHTIEYFNQSDREYFIDYVLKLDDSTWKKAERSLNFGLISRSYWIRFTLETPPLSTSQNRWYLEIGNPLIDQIDVYIQSNNHLKSYHAGDTLKVAARPTPTRLFLFPLPQGQTHHTVYIKYKGSAASAMPLALISANEALASSSNVSLMFGLLFGGMLAIGLLGIGLFYLTRNHNFLYLSAYALTSILFIATFEGYASLMLWPEQPWIQNLVSPPLSLFCIWLGALFSAKVLDFNHHLTPRSYRAFSLASKALIVVCAVFTVLPIFISAIAAIMSVFVVIILMTALSITLARKDNSVAVLFALGWVFLGIYIVLKALFISGYWALEKENFSSHIFYFFHLSFFVSALAKQWIDQQKQFKHKQQVKIERAQAEAQEDHQYLKEQEEQHHTLEALVDERTFELSVTLRELQETNRRLEEQATNDSLTGCKNRKFYDQRLLAEYRLSRRQKTPLSLLMLDIDHFKQVNDNYGHLTGDKVLVSFAKNIIKLLRRPNDYVCRYGGEEFAILLSNTDHKGALKVAELIRGKTQQNNILFDGVPLNITVSIGVSTLTIEDSTADDSLFSLADKALYQAKERGRNQVCGAQSPEN